MQMHSSYQNNYIKSYKHFNLVDIVKTNPAGALALAGEINELSKHEYWKQIFFSAKIVAESAKIGHINHK